VALSLPAPQEKSEKNKSCAEPLQRGVFSLGKRGEKNGGLEGESNKDDRVIKDKFNSEGLQKNKKRGGGRA